MGKNGASNTSGKNLVPRPNPRRSIIGGGPSGCTYRCRLTNFLMVTLSILLFFTLIPMLLWEMPTSDHELRQMLENHIHIDVLQNPFLESKQLTLDSNLHKTEQSPKLKENLQTSSDQRNGAIHVEKEVRNTSENNEGGNSGNREGQRPLARGVSGLPMAQTPALIGAQRGHIQCEVDVDFLAYWNEPQGTLDRSFLSPFAAETNPKNARPKYVTFETDAGGWNNIRMSMEIVVVFALATGRTLVMPPDMPLYLLWKDTKKKHRNVGEFYPTDKWRERLDVITTEEFLRREGGPEGRMPIDPAIKERVMAATQVCEFRRKSDKSCFYLYDHLRAVGLVPQFVPDDMCFIFDRNYIAGKTLTKEALQAIENFCYGRSKMYYDTKMKDATLIHFAASVDGGANSYRMLYHFYAAIIFTDSAIDNYFKRFVRDFMRYNDSIYCAAGKVVRSLQQEGMAMGFMNNEEGVGSYSSLHVRRGELQFKEVKIPAEEWMTNTKELWRTSELLFIATDEKNKTFFDPIAKFHQLRFLDDYWEEANLADLDPNFLGMVDTIVASRGRVFVGTMYSTFTGYINRMRGYHGMTMKDSYFGTLRHKYEMHKHFHPSKLSSGFAREYAVGWVGIDGNVWVKGESDPRNDGNFTAGVSDAISVRKTPALIGAKRGHVQCEVNVDDLVYWNDPQGQADIDFQAPFSSGQGKRQYITFEPDGGGWNNIRMSLEIIFVIAAATGRTLVLPPDSPLYLLNLDEKKKERGFADFFPIHTFNFNRKVPILTLEEFLRLEGGSDGVAPVPDSMRGTVLKLQKQCHPRKKDPLYCGPMFDFLRHSGTVPNLNAKTCLVFDEESFRDGNLTEESKNRVQKFCENRTTIAYYNSSYVNAPLLHFSTSDREHRLLLHFYTFLIFTNPKYDNYYKRFIRDFVHYQDAIFCAAGKIVHALQEMGRKKGFNGAGYSSLHVRRGDLQYKKVKIPASEWYANLHETWEKNEIIYIATDERNKTFFNAIAEQHQLMFLDDFKDLAKLDDLDPNYMGMIDTVVASRGRVFAGTYWSTFSGYINRLRGYYGMSMRDSYYGDAEHKTAMHVWDGNYKMGWNQEFPDGWVGIDSDTYPARDKY